MTTLRVAGAALNQTPLDWEGNLRNILFAIREAKEKQVRILCLPELCITGYGCEDWFLSDYVPEKAFNQLAKIAPECKGIAVAVGLPLVHRGLRYNSVCMIDDERILGFAVKQILAKTDIYYEYRWFSPWQKGQLEEFNRHGECFPIGNIIFNIQGVKTAFEICEDAWHEQLRPGLQYAEQHIDLILNPSASHFFFGKTKLREHVVVEGSRDLRCAYVYTNLLGNESGRIIYDGEILIAQHGKLLQRNNRFSFSDTEFVYADIDFSDPSCTSAPALNADEQDKETEFSEALTLGLFDYLRKSKNKAFALSLSGGADSSLCAVMVAQMVRRSIHALGPEAVNRKLCVFSEDEFSKTSKKDFEEVAQLFTKKLLICAYQSTKNSSEATLQAAQKLADELGAEFMCWSVEEEAASYVEKAEKALGRTLNWERDDIALQNIQARARAPIIWLIANVRNALLITTSNRSESDVGYATMDGDTAGSIAPLAGIDKAYIRRWLRWAEKELGYDSLRYVNALAPTAELRPPARTQTDEEDLMPYELLLEIELLAVRDKKSPEEVYEILKVRNLGINNLEKNIHKFFKKWAANQWKRERIAPSFMVDSFNTDPKTWCRFPILSGGFEEELSDLVKKS